MITLTNKELAERFLEAADLLLIEGGERHRALAFRRSARALEQLSEPAAQLLPLGRLKRVRGIGEGTIHRVKQLLRTGSFDDLERLRGRLPPGIRGMLALRGLGPTKVRLIHQHLGVGSIDELEYAARSGLLQARVPRLGERSAQAILASIEEHRRHRERLSLGVALEIGRGLREGLATSAAVDRVELAGSLRRGLETVGDIDLVAGATDSLATVSAFCALPGLAQIDARGEAAASGRLASGHRVDLWVVEPEAFGAALHAYSGAQPHVVAIRQRAGRMGLQISEHGVFSREDQRLLTACEQEQEVFAAVKLPFIPPELREGAGEIEAAERGRLPRLVTAEDLRGDLHMHTRDSDGLSSARQMAAAARASGLDYIAITDHSGSLAVARGLDAARLQAQATRLRAQQADVELLAGVEVDILADGTLDMDPGVLRGLDWVVASVHSQLQMDPEQMTCRIVRALESGLVDCLGHPTGRRIGSRDASAVDMERVLRAAARAGAAVEINASRHRLDLDAVSARRAGELGVPVVINSDAHAPGELQGRTLGVTVARRAWLEPRQVLNTRSAAELRQWRRRRLGVGAGELIVTLPAEPALEPLTKASGVVDDLSEGLAAGELDEALRRRLRRYLEQDADPALHEALSRLGDNPLQLAFNLLAG